MIQRYIRLYKILLTLSNLLWLYTARPEEVQHSCAFTELASPNAWRNCIPCMWLAHRWQIVCRHRVLYIKPLI